MRIDARNLLDKLGKNDFAYKEFEDRFSELELWPMLEALLRDPRLQAIDPVENVPTAAAAVAEQAVVETFEPLQTEPLSSLFSRYGQGPAASSASDRRGAQAQDVRAMLRHLSDLGSQGKI